MIGVFLFAERIDKRLAKIRPRVSVHNRRSYEWNVIMKHAYRARTLFAAIITLLVFGGCSTIDHTRPPSAEWPALKETVVVSEDAVRAHCKAHWIACAHVNLYKLTCIIYTPSLASWIMDHERAHCRGYDHPGETTFRDHFEQWRAWKESEQRK